MKPTDCVVGLETMPLGSLQPGPSQLRIMGLTNGGNPTFPTLEIGPERALAAVDRYLAAFRSNIDPHHQVAKALFEDGEALLPPSPLRVLSLLML